MGEGTSNNNKEESSSSSSMQQRRRKRRWGTATTTEPTTTAAAAAITSTSAATTVPTSTSSTGTSTADSVKAKLASIQARLAAAKQQQQQGTTVAAAATTAPTSTTTVTTTTTTAANDAKAKLASIQARLAAAKAAAAAVSTAQPTAASRSGIITITASGEPQQQRPTKRAKHFELDMSITVPSYKDDLPSFATGGSASTTGTSAKKAPTTTTSNPYLAHQDDNDEKDTTTEKKDSQAQEGDGIDHRLDGRAMKQRQRNKAIKFITPGQFVSMADRQRAKLTKAAESGYLSGRKTGHSVQAVVVAGTDGMYSGTEPGTTATTTTTTTTTGTSTTQLTIDTLPPRWDAHPDTKMPVAVEWWDVALLPSKLKKQVAAVEAQALVPNSTKNKVKTATAASGTTEEGTESKNSNTEHTVSKNNSTEPKQDNDNLRTQCFAHAKLTYSKTSELVQHIVPVRPPHVAQHNDGKKEPVLHLTKKERRRQRKLRRREKQREQQDLQAAGLIPAPEPRLTLQNFIRVLGDQAFVDPSQMEQKVMQQMQARQEAHLARNEANKLTKEQRAAKRAAKLQQDADTTTTDGVVHVAVFYVKDMSHPYHRAKVDLNAQQYHITGGVIEVSPPTFQEDDGATAAYSNNSTSSSMACVVCEGGPKAVKKYIRLMTVRMKWTGPNDDDDDESEEEDNVDHNNGEIPTQKFNPNNTCALVWEGLTTKRLFTGFSFQSCETPEQARKILKGKGVAHYWDQVVAHASTGQSLGFRLATHNGGDSDEDNPFAQEAAAADDDVVMRDA
jgi:U4/U6 small nuclear ribonucleoprotein PRP3